MKVLHLISGGDSGGAKTHVLSLLRDLNKHIDAELVCYMEGKFSAEARELGIPVEVFGGGFAAGLKKTRKKIAGGGYDIVQCHGSRANLTGALLKRHFNIPFISTVHSDYKLDYLGRPLAAMTYGRLNAFALHRMDYRVCVADSTRQILIERGFDPNGLLTIYNGVDFSLPEPELTRREWFSGIGCDFPDNAVVLGIAARLDPVKDVETTVRGFALASESCPELRLLIAGDGMERQRLEELCAELGIESKVFFAGWLNDMSGYYASVDINAISSLSESFPYAVTEASRARIPTVASRVGGLPKLIINGETGLLFEPKDAEGMARCITRLALDKELRSRLGEAVYEKARLEFSTESTCRRQLKIYKTVLERYSGGRSGVVICGAYGHGNAGDDSLLSAISSQLKTLDEDMLITVVSKDAKNTRRVHGLSAIARWRLLSLHGVLKKTKLFISGGGSLIQDVTSRRSLWFYLHTIYLAKRYGCRVQMYGCGMGPLIYENDRIRAASVINSCVDAITLRDPQSMELAREIGITVKDVRVTGDPTVGMEPKAEADVCEALRRGGIDPDRQYVCISMRPWEGFDEERGEIAEAVKNVCLRHSLTPLIVPMNYDKDLSVCTQLAKDIGLPFETLPRTDDASLVAAVIRRSALMVAMRLHGVLYAVCGEVPVVGISYDPKVSGSARYLGAACLDLDGLKASELETELEAALAKTKSGELQKRLDYIRNAEKANLQTASRLLNE